MSENVIEETLNEDLAVIFSLAVLSDGERKEVEEKYLKSSPLFTKEIEAIYKRYIKILEVIQTDNDTLSLQLFSKIIAYSDKLSHYKQKKEVYAILEQIILSDKVITTSEEQFLSIMRDKWNIKQELKA